MRFGRDPTKLFPLVRVSPTLALIVVPLITRDSRFRMTRHRQETRRTASVPLKILEQAPSEPDPEASEPAPQADYYGGMDLQDHPVPGQKAGPVILPKLPFPDSIHY